MVRVLLLLLMLTGCAGLGRGNHDGMNAAQNSGQAASDHLLHHTPPPPPPAFP